MKNFLKYFFLSLIISALLIRNSIAQNLVPNGSFELQYSCPTSTSQVDSCIDWFTVINTPFNFCSPDYFSTCALYPVSIPDNLCGFQFPFSGSAYMGLYTYLWSSFYREIIGVELIDSMIPGNNYHISMRVSRGNWTNQAYNCSASNKLGIRFTTFRYTSIDTPAINNFAQIYTDSIVEDTINWVLLEWDYIADSAYTHAYIGNFFDDAHTDTTVIAAPIGQFGQAYYFIDSININCVSENCFDKVDNINKAIPMLFYDPLQSIIFSNALQSDNNIVILYNETGQEIIKQSISDNKKIHISELNNGFYIAVLIANGVTSVKKIIKF